MCAKAYCDCFAFVNIDFVYAKIEIIICINAKPAVILPAITQ